MNYRKLGKTGLMVSEIGLGGEWLERHSAQEVEQVIRRCQEAGINILDCWMSEPNVRSNIGSAIAGSREKWHIQGHIGSTWQGGQYVRTRELPKVRAAFQDLLDRMRTDYIDLGMIHFVDEPAEFHKIMEGEFIAYVRGLKEAGAIRHIGMSTHNPSVAKLAAESGEIEMILLSVNPAFDMLPASENIDDYFAEKYDESLGGISAERSPFGVALTPVQCIHYCLTRPAVASVMVGFDTPEHVDAAVAYETATMEEKDYASVLASAPRHGYYGQCTYCGHCAPCPAGIDIAMVNKLYDLALMQEQLPASLKAHYDQLSANADACIGCKGCESRCPFGVKIAERMAKTKAHFG